ncbi:MAG: hypothetical protein HY329_21870 [Chloroflexi bacterium]|nr:hypothetical protein [Chloroflexota bacterium]
MTRRVLGLALTVVALAVLTVALAFKTPAIANSGLSNPDQPLVVATDAPHDPGIVTSVSGGVVTFTINDKMQPDSVYTFGTALRLTNAGTVPVTDLAYAAMGLGGGVTLELVDTSSDVDLGGRSLAAGASTDLKFRIRVPADYPSKGGALGTPVSGTLTITGRFDGGSGGIVSGPGSDSGGGEGPISAPGAGTGEQPGTGGQPGSPGTSPGGTQPGGPPGGTQPGGPPGTTSGPPPLVSAPPGVRTVVGQPGSSEGACGLGLDPSRGGIWRILPAGNGAAAVLTTSSSALAYVTAIVPTRDVPVAVRLQPQPVTAVGAATRAGAEPIRVFSLDLFQQQACLPLATHSGPATIVVQITREELDQVGGDPRRLAITHYDAATSQHFRLPTQFDLPGLTLRTETTRTGLFAVMQLPEELAPIVVERPLPLVPLNGLPTHRVRLPFVVKNFGNWSTGFQVQNLGSLDAEVNVTFYDRNGTVVWAELFAIAAGGSRTFYDESLPVPDGFDGSAVVNSTQTVAVTVNEVALNPPRSAGYDGVSVPTLVQNLPLVMRNNNGWNTEIVIQNGSPSGRPANVRVEYYEGPALFKIESLPPLAPGAATRIRQMQQTELGAHWVGSARVVADQPIATVVNQYHPRMLMSYSGFAAGVGRVSLPLVMYENNGWSTGLQVQNVGPTPVPVTLRVNGSEVARVTLGAGTSQTWYPIPGVSPGFVGAATVEGPPGSQLVAIVNQMNPTTGQATSYRGFGGGSSVTSAPLVMRDNSRWYTGIQVQNVGSQPTTVSLYLDGRLVDSAHLLSGHSKTWFPVPGTGPGFVGSVVARGEPDSQIVAVVNTIQIDGDPGDSALTYEGYNR